MRRADARLWPIAIACLLAAILIGVIVALSIHPTLGPKPSARTRSTAAIAIDPVPRVAPTADASPALVLVSPPPRRAPRPHGPRPTPVPAPEQDQVTVTTINSW